MSRRIDHGHLEAGGVQRLRPVIPPGSLHDYELDFVEPESPETLLPVLARDAAGAAHVLLSLRNSGPMHPFSGDEGAQSHSRFPKPGQRRLSSPATPHIGGSAPELTPVPGYLPNYPQELLSTAVAFNSLAWWWFIQGVR